MSAQPALAVVPEPAEPEFGDGDGGDPHAPCAEAMVGFLAMLTVRLTDRDPALGEAAEEEIAALLAEYRQNQE